MKKFLCLVRTETFIGEILGIVIIIKLSFCVHAMIFIDFFGKAIVIVIKVFFLLLLLFIIIIITTIIFVVVFFVCIFKLRK